MLQSFFRHPGLAQTSEKGSFAQGADLYVPERSQDLQAGDARIAVVEAQPAGFVQLGGSALGLADEGGGGGEIAANRRMFRSIAACLLEPRLVGPAWVSDLNRLRKPTAVIAQSQSRRSSRWKGGRPYEISARARLLLRQPRHRGANRTDRAAARAGSTIVCAMFRALVGQ